jgi:hypothetical protein
MLLLVPQDRRGLRVYLVHLQPFLDLQDLRVHLGNLVHLQKLLQYQAHRVLLALHQPFLALQVLLVYLVLADLPDPSDLRVPQVILLE